MKHAIIILSLFCAVASFAQADSGFAILHTGTAYVKYSRVVYKDTILASYTSEDPLTLRREKGGGRGTAMHPDTTFYYNHFGYMLERARREVDHWSEASDKAYDLYEKTGHAKYYVDHVTAVRRSEYWAGVRDGISLVLYHRYNDPYLLYEFKSKAP